MPNRPTISVSATFYARLVAYCDKHGLSLGGLVDQVVTAELDKVQQGAPPPSVPKTRPTFPKPRPVATDPDPGRAEPCAVCGELGHTYRKHNPNGIERAAYTAPEQGDPTPLRTQLDRAIKKHRIPSMGDADSVPMSRGPGESTAARAYGADSVNLHGRRPGEQLHRISQRAGGKAIDRDEAHRKVAQKPWASTARYLGVSRGFHVFAYRDTETT